MGRGDALATRAPIFIAVTGAQGVGKSTFCTRLKALLDKQGLQPTLLAGLGAALTAQGYVMGNKADERAVAAVVQEHLRREREAPNGIVLLDRCLVDMLAYKRTLDVTPSPLSEVYEEIVRAVAPRLKLVVFLEMGDCFKISDASHEDARFRERIDTEIQAVIGELGLPTLSLDASMPDSLARATAAIRAVEGAQSAETL